MFTRQNICAVWFFFFILFCPVDIMLSVLVFSLCNLLFTDTVAPFWLLSYYQLVLHKWCFDFFLTVLSLRPTALRYFIIRRTWVTSPRKLSGPTLLQLDPMLSCIESVSSDFISDVFFMFKKHRP